MGAVESTCSQCAACDVPGHGPHIDNVFRSQGIPVSGRVRPPLMEGHQRMPIRTSLDPNDRVDAWKMLPDTDEKLEIQQVHGFEDMAKFMLSPSKMCLPEASAPNGYVADSPHDEVVLEGSEWHGNHYGVEETRHWDAEVSFERMDGDMVMISPSKAAASSTRVFRTPVRRDEPWPTPAPGSSSI
mmetsp:Transcript_38055/g.82981  ORF Transcript_38055/g.82981 Transcript_38055/m.82981 type:complete len:185 (+) Transcript_38055:102-656(+)